ncbi:MAG: ABC transporter ATP-binding protein [Desulfurococcaceae archaeon]|nr:ABC transporter ATP-binding protein [Desulfurococcaceae archaeon]
MRVRVEGMSFSYDSYEVLNDVTLDIEPCKVTCVIGPNGAGKTTLLKVIASILKPTKGTVYLDFKDLRLYNPKEIARIIAYSEPNISKSIPVKVLDLIITARYPFQGNTQFFEDPNDLRIVDEVCRELNITYLLNKRLDQVSSGELQRVLIATALVKNPKVLLLDEPSAFLDIRYRFEVLRYVKEVTTKYGLTTVVALHDLQLASMFCDEIVLMDRGRIVKYGTVNEVLTSDVIKDVYGVDVEVITLSDNSLVIIPKPR